MSNLVLSRDASANAWGRELDRLIRSGMNAAKATPYGEIGVAIQVHLNQSASPSKVYDLADKEVPPGGRDLAEKIFDLAYPGEDGTFRSDRHRPIEVYSLVGEPEEFDGHWTRDVAVAGATLRPVYEEKREQHGILTPFRLFVGVTIAGATATAVYLALRSRKSS